VYRDICDNIFVILGHTSNIMTRHLYQITN